MEAALFVLVFGNLVLFAFLLYLLVRLRSLKELKDRLSDLDR
jgi:hypothetical protein